jgi:hypothetical protein
MPAGKRQQFGNKRFEPRSFLWQEHRTAHEQVDLGNQAHSISNLMFYLANVMVEVYHEPNVEADYAKLNVYAIAKYPKRPTNAKDVWPLADRGHKIRWA